MGTFLKTSVERSWRLGSCSASEGQTPFCEERASLCQRESSDLQTMVRRQLQATAYDDDAVFASCGANDACCCLGYARKS